MTTGKRRLLSPILMIVVPFVCLWLALPEALLAVDNEKAGGRGRFRLDLYGGLSLLNPGDMNQIVDYDTSVREFTYDAYFDYLRANGMILSWNEDGNGAGRKIRHAFPFGIRVRYALLDFFALSVGFEFLRRGPNDSLHVQYTRHETAAETYLETLDTSPYRLETRAYWPSVGIHFFKRFGKALDAEAFAAGGPLFAACSYESHRTYTWTIQGQGYAWETFKSEDLLAEDGSGIGISLEVGGRLSLPVRRGIDVFLESGYAYQMVKSLSGEGSEIKGETEKTWEGKWRVKSETMTTPWGTRTLRFPTNYETGGPGTGDFRLDLSGFRIRIGASLGF